MYLQVGERHLDTGLEDFSVVMQVLELVILLDDGMDVVGDPMQQPLLDSAVEAQACRRGRSAGQVCQFGWCPVLKLHLGIHVLEILLGLDWPPVAIPTMCFSL